MNRWPLRLHVTFWLAIPVALLTIAFPDLDGPITAGWLLWCLGNAIYDATIVLGNGRQRAGAEWLGWALLTGLHVAALFVVDLLRYVLWRARHWRKQRDFRAARREVEERAERVREWRRSVDEAFERLGRDGL